MKLRRKYHLNQSPLYKLSSHQVLAKVLGIDQSILKRILKKGDLNYMFGKAPGSSRDIQVPKSQMYRIHRRIAKLLSRIQTPNYLCSGVKGRSHVTNAQMHRGEIEVAKVDIEKFYPSTSREIIKKGLRKKFHMPVDIAETFSRLVTVKGFLPTGSPLSQALAFFVNSPVFDHIDSYAKSRGLTFSLYVDDLTFSGEVIPKELFSFLKKYMKDNRGYKLHKFRNYNAKTEKVVTGVVIDGNNIKVKKSHRRIIWELMKALPVFSDPTKVSDVETISYFQKYIGHLFAAGQISPRYKQLGKRANELRSKIGVPGKNQHSAP